MKYLLQYYASPESNLWHQTTLHNTPTYYRLFAGCDLVATICNDRHNKAILVLHQGPGGVTKPVYLFQ